MTNTAVAVPLYESAAFLVVSLPEQGGAQLISFGQDNPAGKISSVEFEGMDAALFLHGFSNALDRLSSDEEVEAQYLNQYGPLMRSRYLH